MRRESPVKGCASRCHLQYSSSMAGPNIEGIICKTNEVLKNYEYPAISSETERMLAISASIKASQDLRLRGTFAVIGALSLIGAWITSGGGFTSHYVVAFLALISISGACSFFKYQDMGSRDAASAILNHRANNLE